MKQELLFLTNFSEACFQAVPVLADWIDRQEAGLTLLHVHSPGLRQAEVAGRRLRSFFAEADRYDRCQRVLLAGNPRETIIDYCRREQPDVVLAPASEARGLPQLFHRSLRAELLLAGDVALWTRGRSRGAGPAPKKTLNVAYAIRGNSDWLAEAAEAAEYAQRRGARLHLLYLAAWPDVHDGTLPTDLRGQAPSVSMEDLGWLVDSLPGRPEVHYSLGDQTSDLVRLLRECQADVAFVGEEHAVRRRRFSCLIDPQLDRLPCEVFCLRPSRAVARTRGRVNRAVPLLRPAFSHS